MCSVLLLLHMMCVCVLLYIYFCDYVYTHHSTSMSKQNDAEHIEAWKRKEIYEVEARMPRLDGEKLQNNRTTLQEMEPSIQKHTRRASEYPRRRRT